MLNQKIYLCVFAVLTLLLSSCASPGGGNLAPPKKLLLGDGGVFIEQEIDLDKKGRSTAAFKNKHYLFQPSKTSLKGTPWVDESSEFYLNDDLNPEGKCSIQISRTEADRNVASRGKDYIYQIKVRVEDGIKDGPFENMINGEGEGIIQIGEYPMNSFASNENLILQDTVVPSWRYEPKNKHYEIVKKMGDNRFLKKTLKFGPYLRKVAKLEYQILSDSGDQVDQQMNVLARLSCL